MDRSIQELKLTAIVYCKHGAAKHLRETGRLPDRIGGAWSVIPMRLTIEERGTDPVLTAEEQDVYDAILREQRLPGGSVHLVDPHRDGNRSVLLKKLPGKEVNTTRSSRSSTRSSAADASAVSVDQFIAAIEALPETKISQGSNKVWYSSQKEHWLGWLSQYSGAGAYGRKRPGKDAMFAYNHIVNPQMLLWLIQAAGVSEDRVTAAASVADVGTTLMQKAGAVRKQVPWAEVAKALWPGADAT
jgi:hypothetical protein